MSSMNTKQAVALLMEAQKRGVKSDVIHNLTMNVEQVYDDETNNYVGRNANGKRVLEPGSTSEERKYIKKMRHTVDTTPNSIDVLTGKMSRLTIEDRKGKIVEPEEIIVLNGSYISCY